MNNIYEFLSEYNTLLPENTEILPIINDDWWIAVSSQFDDIAWLYYANREVMSSPRFPEEFPEIAYENIQRSIAIYLIQNRRRYERIFNAFTADFNPLWNVDGVTGTISENNKTGYDELARSGDDTVDNSGTDTNVKSGNQTDAGSGFDKLIHHYDSSDTRTGHEIDSYEGQETNTTEVTTFDDSTLKTTEKVTTGYGEPLQGTQKIIDKQYDDVQDTKSGEDYDKNELGSTKTLTFNDVTDEFTHGKQEKTTYNSKDKTTYNNKDNFVEMVIRQGNIGVTRSDELITHAIELFNSSLYDFYKMVVRDCINQVTYRIY